MSLLCISSVSPVFLYERVSRGAVTEGQQHTFVAGLILSWCYGRISYSLHLHLFVLLCLTERENVYCMCFEFLFCQSFRWLKMKRSPQWRNLCLNVSTYQQTSSGYSTRGKRLQVDLPTFKRSIIAVSRSCNSFLHASSAKVFDDGNLYCFPSDEHRLSDYSIGPEAKLNLVIRPVGERTGASGMVASSSSSTHGGVWQTVSTILARHFSPADAAKVHEQLIKVFKCCIFAATHCNLIVHPDTWTFSGFAFAMWSSVAACGNLRLKILRAASSTGWNDFALVMGHL